MTQHLGILGGGQLGRMLALAARPLGIDVTVLEPNPESPARAVAHHLVAEYDDERALRELAHCDVVTFEFENIPDQAVRLLAQNQAVYPPPEALRVSQDRFTEKSTFRELGIETARFQSVDSLEDARAAFLNLGPLVLKTRRFGYDGKGQAVARQEADLEAAYAALKGAPAIAEELIPFDRELSVIAVRARDGEIAIYPLSQNTHRNGILHTSVAPAPNVSAPVEKEAKEMIEKLVARLSYVGVLALELFQVGEKLLANEFAPRVHNSGHWTIEGAVTSQFENHLRAVCGLPLGQTSLRAPSVMTNLIGRVPPHEEILALPDCHLHDYQKAPRSGRKVGHVTTLGVDLKAAEAVAEKVARLISPEQ
jgi:5-(carboxyamino)imidazole ribonucleotide synthase